MVLVRLLLLLLFLLLFGINERDVVKAVDVLVMIMFICLVEYFRIKLLYFLSFRNGWCGVLKVLFFSYLSLIGRQGRQTLDFTNSISVTFFLEFRKFHVNKFQMFNEFLNFKLMNFNGKIFFYRCVFWYSNTFLIQKVGNKTPFNSQHQLIIKFLFSVS